jgi:hypothetical protein
MKCPGFAAATVLFFVAAHAQRPVDGRFSLEATASLPEALPTNCCVREAIGEAAVPSISVCRTVRIPWTRSF